MKGMTIMLTKPKYEPDERDQCKLLCSLVGMVLPVQGWHASEDSR